MGDFVDGVVGNVKAVGNAVVDGVKAVGTALTGGGNKVNTYEDDDYETFDSATYKPGTVLPDGGVVVKDLITGEANTIYPEGKKDPNDVEKDNDNKDPQQSDGGADDTRDEVENQSSQYDDALANDSSNANAQGYVDGTNTLNSNASLTEQSKNIQVDADSEGTSIDGTDPKYNTDTDQFNADAAQVNLNDVSTVDQIDGKDAVGYDVENASDQIGNEQFQVDPITGEVINVLDADDYDIDMEGAGTGVNEDGSINQTGVALDNFATNSMTTIIDTSTTSGKLLAEQLGEFNYTDSKATTLGQLEIISKQFTDADGNPKIPAWGQALARQVSRNISFNGVTGTAAMAAMSTALMEATLPIASEDASFFQTLTIENLDNKQESIINKAKVLANFETLNLSARETAAVTNNKNLMDMDFKNMDNKMQAEVINKSAAVTAFLQDVGEENVARRFLAQSQNEKDMFYDDMIVRISKINADAKNAALLTNVTEQNRISINNSNLESAREQFYQTQQYNIDLATAQWRQEVATTNTKLQFEAAATDVRNNFDLSIESLNQIWDRADSILDYAWKSSESVLDRDNRIAMAMIQAKSGKKGSIWSALGSITGSLIGTEAGSTAFLAAISDERLKENIVKVGSTETGHNVYTWDWTEEAIKIGANHKMTKGVLAQEVMKTHPEAVLTHDSGYYMVNYGKI